jgi:hypothetical protein
MKKGATLNRSRLEKAGAGMRATEAALRYTATG